MTDDLLRRLQNGEPDAARELFRYCDTRLRSFLLARLPNVDDLDDCVSEVVTRALEGIERGPQPRVLAAWLTGIAKNVLKERYQAKNLAGGELPDDIPTPQADPPLELSRTDLPHQVSEYEMRVGKRQLWDMLHTATSSLSASLAAIMRTHMELTLRRGHLVVGTELAEAVGQPVDIVNRQLNRGKARMLAALVPLVLARPGGSSCPVLAGLLRETLRPDQLRAGRKLALDSAQATTILDHANECAACAPHVDDARDFSKWALGPGLIGLADDDEERRRAIIAMLDRAGDARLGGQSPVAALGVIPAAPAVEPGGIVERVRTAVAARAAMLPRPDGVVRFAQENPDAFRRVLTAVASGVVVVAAVVVSLLATNPPDHTDPRDPPQAVDGGDAPATTSPTTTSPTPAATPSPPAPTTAAPVAAPKIDQGPHAGTGSPPTTTTTAPPTTGPSQPPPPAGAIGIDVSDTDYPNFRISGVAGLLDARKVHQLRLSPGQHTVTSGSGRPFAFQVTEDRRVTYDPALEGMFTGGGSATLAVHGAPIVLDMSDMDHSNTGIVGISQTTERRHAYRLLPGPHHLLVNNGRSYGFTVTDDRQVRYDSSLEGRLTGSGSPTLAVHGSPIVLDVSDVDYSHTGMSGTFVTKDRRHTYRLLPGSHYVVVANRASHPFTVTADGRVTYNPGLHGQLTGDGSTTLAVHGFQITMDVSDLAYTDTGIGGMSFVTKDRRHTYRLLPGPHYIVILNTASHPFTVTADGRVTYNPGLHGQLTGDGSTTIAVHGFPITIDATASGEAAFAMSGVGIFDARRRHVFRLLPVGHQVRMPSGVPLYFRITGSGHVTYDRSFDNVLSGRESPELIIRRTRG